VRVLVVDDDDLVRTVAVDTLEDVGSEKTALTRWLSNLSLRSFGRLRSSWSGPARHLALGSPARPFGMLALEEPRNPA
jgi:hypothetical protein